MKKLFLLFTLAFMVLSCEEAQDFIDEKGHGLVFLEGEMKAYFDDKGDTKNYKFKADLAWSAEVSADWVEANPTSGPAGENKIKIKVDKNKSDEKRTGYVDITLSNEKSYRIELEQLASGENLDDIIEPTTPIPNNEIWYTSIDGEIVEPNDPMAFNVSIKSNIYEDGKGVITFDGEVTEVGEMAFYGCDNCTTNCYNLTSFILPQSVTSIGNHAFDGCRNLQSVTISDNVTHIGEAAFICCTGLKEFNSKYASEDGRCLIIDGTLNSFAPAGLTEYTIPDSVTTIGGGAFYNCTKLQSITWGKGVKTVGGSAFNNCTGLNAVHISDLAAWCDIDFIISTGTENPLYYARNLYLDGDLVTDLVIPESITEIKQLAFFYCGSIKNLTIHDNLTSIGHNAFQNCDGMESVTIGDSVTTIGRYAFTYCSNLTSVTIGESVTEIGDYAFYNCSSLTSITIPDSVTTIGNHAFRDCSSLTSVTMGKGIETVGGYAFNNCSSLNAVHISDLASWCNIDFVNPISNGFSLAANPLIYACNLYLNGGLITELVIPESVTEIKFLTFIGCSASNIVFHDNIKSIGPCAFSRCENIENLVIGNGVEYIGNVAFGRCPKLTSVTMSENIASYGYNVFLECYNLVEFKGVYATEDGRALSVNNMLLAYANASGSEYTIPDGITAIYQGAFFNCVNLRSVTIPESVTGIGYMAFGYNSNLESVYCKPTTPPSINMNAFQYPNEDGEYVNAPCKIYVPAESVEAYKSAQGWSDYADRIVAEGSIPEDAQTSIIRYTTIDGNPITPNNNMAVKSNTYINGEGILEFYGNIIGDSAFRNCYSLTSITISDSVTTIGKDAFRNCYSLTSVTIPDSVTTIGDWAFYNCSSLTSVYISDISAWCNISFSGWDSNPLSNGCNLYLNNELVTDLTIPNSVTTIGGGAFYGCTSLTSITIHDSVTTIGVCAFYECYSLTSVTIPDSVTTIGEWAFSLCESLTSVTIPDSVTKIGDAAFYRCSSLTSVTIPNSVTKIGSSAFGYCNSLTSVTIPNSVTTIGDSAFYACISLTSVTIPDSVTTIRVGAFSGCSSLQEFNGKFASEDGRCLIIDGTLNSFAPGGLVEYTIPDSVTTIGESAFYSCESLTSVTIPDSVTTIGWGAFEGCSSLTSVTIPDSVTTIGMWAFGWCYSLTSVYCKPTTPPAALFYEEGWCAFDANSSGRKIYVPTKSVEAYKSAEGWSEYADAIVGYDF